MDSKNLHSDLYYKLRNQIETTWPQWKIDAANEFICSKNSKLLIKRNKMTCYREGGCGPYENRSCYECPASKPEYVIRAFKDFDAKKVEAIQKEGIVYIIPTETKPIKIVIESGSENENLDEYFLNLNKPLTEEEIKSFLDLVKGG